jgi:hypothetical protein
MTDVSLKKGRKRPAIGAGRSSGSSAPQDLLPIRFQDLTPTVFLSWFRMSVISSTVEACRIEGIAPEINILSAVHLF